MDYHTTGSPKRPSKQSPFFTASLILGILSLRSICTVIFPLIFGGLSVLFAILSKRRNEDMNVLALAGVICSSISIAFTIVIFTMTIIQLPHNLRDENYRAMLNATSQDLYGITFDEMMEESGIDLDSLLD